MRKIAIFQSDLNVGGITKSLINFINKIDKLEFEIDLYLYSKIIFFSYEFGDNVNIYFLKRAPKIYKYFPIDIVKKLYLPNIKSNQKYDIAIDYNSFWQECALGVIATEAPIKIMWLHSDIVEKKKVEFRYRVAWFLQYGKLKYFDKFVAVSKGVKDSYYKSVSGENSTKEVTVINNIIDVENVLSQSQVPIETFCDASRYNLICVGHLGREKGIDILIKTFYQVQKLRKDMSLYIIGDGPEKKKIEKLIRKYQLQNVVTLLGSKNNPYPYMKQMDGFCLMSRYEGQGIVLWEAKLLGLEVFIPNSLEKYNSGIASKVDMVDALVSAHKKIKSEDKLLDYSAKIDENLARILL